MEWWGYGDMEIWRHGDVGGSTIQHTYIYIYIYTNMYKYIIYTCIDYTYIIYAYITYAVHT